MIELRWLTTMRQEWNTHAAVPVRTLQYRQLVNTADGPPDDIRVTTVWSSWRDVPEVPATPERGEGEGEADPA